MHVSRCWLLLISVAFSPLYGKDDGATMNLLPIPAAIQEKEGKFRVDASFAAVIVKECGPRLKSGTTRMLKRLSERTGLFLSPSPLSLRTEAKNGQFLIQCERQGRLALGEHESYRLDITPGKITLSARTDLGALHGMETLLQLLRAGQDGYFFPSLMIDDSPRFPWRGILIDVARHFMPLEVLKRNLDGMAAVKMNVLHLHLTDDQGFRIESKRFPKLQEQGSDGMYFTQEQIKEIIDYADERGIRVMPEFDLPGHSTSWFVGYPEFASAPGPYAIERKWGIFNPTFDPTREETYVFLDAFLGEMALLFTDDYIHIGGDENKGAQWNANAGIQTFMKERGIPDIHTLQSYFNQRLFGILTKHGKKMVGWDEILDSSLPKNIVIQSWRGKSSLFDAARAGYQTILSKDYYIDLMQSAEFHYLNDPFPADSQLTDEEAGYILGGEAAMWSEFVTPETIDSRIWPRTAAIAERLWSPPRVRNVEDLYRRLEEIGVRLEELGLTHEKNYSMMLRRLTNNNDIAPLKVLVDVLEPVKNYQRSDQKEVLYTSFSPMGRVVDAARPESMNGRRFRMLVSRYVVDKNPATRDEIRLWLTLWKGNHEKLSPTILQSPILKEIESLSQDLSTISAVGLEAIDRAASGPRSEDPWAQQSTKIVEKAQAPRGQVELVVVGAIQKLVSLTREQ